MRMLRQAPEATGLKYGFTPNEQLPLNGVQAVTAVFRKDIWRWSRLTHEVELEEIVAKYSGRWRKRYERALETYHERGLEPKDSRIKAFVKREKVVLHKGKNKPRMIWGRDPVYNLLLASYLHPIEGELYRRLKTPRRCLVPPTRMVAKGLNPKQRASLIRRKMLGVKDCVVFEIDMTAFEAHHGEWFLALEHETYKKMNPDPMLAHLLGQQVHNKGSTSNRVRFSRRGGRASGDYNTGLGNSLAMVAMSLAAMDFVVPGSQYDILVDGDNALLFMPQSVVERVVEGLPRVFLCFGHEAKLERPTRVAEEVRFGQSAPLEVAKGEWTMVREPMKVLSGMFTSHRHYQELRGGKSIAKTIAQCELVLNCGVPILQRYAELALEELVGVSHAKNPEPDNYLQAQVLKDKAWQQKRSRQVSDVARDSFARAFGIGAADQILIEQTMRVDFPSAWSDVEQPLIGDEKVCDQWLLAGFDQE